MLLSDIINYGLYGLALSAVLGGAALGFKRGIGKQTIKLVLMLGSIVLSFWVSMKIYPLVYGFIAGRPIADTCAMIGITFDPTTAGIINSVEIEAAAYILAIPLMLVLIPIIAMLIFAIASGLLMIPSLFICGVLGFGNKYNNIFTRMGGAAIGAIEFFVALCVVLAPFVGIVNVAGDAIKNAEAKYPDAANTVAIGTIYHSNAEKLETNRVFKFIDSNFGYMYDEYTDLEMNGHEVQMEKVASDFFELFVLYGELGGANFDSPSPEVKETMNTMVEVFGKDEYMTTIASGVVKSASSAMINGNIQLNIEEPMATFVHSLLNVFATSDKTTIEADLKTVLSIYYVITDSGAIGNMGDQNAMLQSFLTQDEEGKSVINLILETLDSNPRFSHVSADLSDFAMSMLMQGMGNDGDVKETLDEVKGTLNNIVSINKEDYATEEEYKADVSKEIDDTLKNNGLELTDEQLSKVTDYVITEFEGKEEITDMDMALFMAKYYDVYGTVPEIPEDGGLPEIPDDFEIPDLGDGEEDDIPEIPDDFEIPDDVEIPDDIEIPDDLEIPQAA